MNLKELLTYEHKKLNPKEFIWINFLRYIAIVYLFLYHYAEYYYHEMNQYLIDFCEAGFFGTSLFFILSGFILTYVYDKSKTGQIEVRKFWIARLSRLYPLHILTILFFIPFSYFGSVTYSGHQQVVFPLTNMLLVHAWIPDKEYLYSFNEQSWSLSALLFFYFFFPYILKLTRNIKRTVLALGILCLLYLIPSAIFMFSGEPDYGWLYYLVRNNPLIRFPEFIAGVLIARLLVSDNPGYLKIIEKLNQYRWLIILFTLFLLFNSSIFNSTLIHNGLFLPLQIILVLSLTRNPDFSKISQLKKRVYELFNLLGASSLSFYMINGIMMTLLFRFVLVFNLAENPTAKWSFPLSLHEYKVIASTFGKYKQNFQPDLFVFFLFLVLITIISVYTQKLLTEPISFYIRKYYKVI